MSIVSQAEVLAFMGLGASPTESELGLLGILHPMVESRVIGFLGFNPEQKTYTEFYPESGRGILESETDGIYDVTADMAVLVSGRLDEIFLRNRPVRSVTSVFVDYDALAGQASGAFGPSTEIAAGVDFYLDNLSDGFCPTGRLVKRNGVWPDIARSVKVTYVAGFTPTELKTEHACIKLAVLTAMQYVYMGIKQRKKIVNDTPGLMLSEHLGDWSATYASQQNLAQELSSAIAVLPKASAQLLEPYMRIDV